jgi:hypothetical protein
VPLTLMAQSPIFQSEPFQFGPTAIGTTQYIDAFQRGNFWQFVGGTGYHTLLNPREPTWKSGTCHSGRRFRGLWTRSSRGLRRFVPPDFQQLAGVLRC